ncbi:Two-component system histidine kinase DccS [hydrothermal vent metagenome]|uniref:histidine kinase n=1 Tax=hydrothermal vent metagenome TaxID=652676 RepID=A0A1W1EIJ3_9ZZZZ
MKSYEKESFFKNFLLFFGLLEIVIILLFIQLYDINKKQYSKVLLNKMHICSYSLSCKEFLFDFVSQDKKVLNHLYINSDAYAFFYIPQSKDYYIKILYSKDKLEEDTSSINQKLTINFIITSIIFFFISILLTRYTLQPIRQAMQLNDEFIKDILHDFNTPITAMVLNIEMLKSEKENAFINRLSYSIDTILLLQNNLKSFLINSPSQNQSINITTLIKKRIEFIKNIYPNITFIYNDLDKLIKYTNEDLLTRIIDNLLSNSAKYNKPYGKVILTITNNSIIIEDSGKGIKDVKKVFQRYYKEQSRGLGLGLHIVEKFTKELDIKLHIESQINIGTKITLEFI